VRFLLAFDPGRCLACGSCELACSVVHSSSGRLETAISETAKPRRRVTLSKGNDGIQALRCEQCGEPLCAYTCKSGALRRDPTTGQVVFEESLCVGCFMCLMVCASGVRPDPATGHVVRCDVCLGRDVPACAAACPTGALGKQEAADDRPRGDFRGHVVVVGSSAAGIAACESAREHAPDCAITLVTADRNERYSRPLLPYLLAGRIDAPHLEWRADGYIENELNVRVMRGRRAVRLRVPEQTLEIDRGETLTYDRLIVATGARPTMPDLPGIALTGVCTLRDLEDLETLERLAVRGRRVVVLGGGNVGLQACEALAERGLNVTVVVASAHLLSQMVDAEAGRRVGDLMAANGITVRTGQDAAEILGEGCVSAVRLSGGEQIPADLVVVGKGIRPNVEWLLDSGLCLQRGIVTDRCGRTNVPGVFAAGDCAEVPDPLTGRSSISGIWPVAYEMGRAAGSTAVGIESVSAGALRMNASKFFDVPVVSIGEVRPESLPGARAELLAATGAVYRKLVWKDSRLLGALLFGDISGAGGFYRMYRDGGN
jgi:nitrite reductase (NADH) large subunit